MTPDRRASGARARRGLLRPYADLSGTLQGYTELIGAVGAITSTARSGLAQQMADSLLKRC
ncbi:hypothetical protein AQF52_2405 [Streptomyces venezuelae]|nr:hypothetical protein AQF52_2405 [Streptomyces venezuelae]